MDKNYMDNCEKRHLTPQAMHNQFKRPSAGSVRELYYIYRKILSNESRDYYQSGWLPSAQSSMWFLFSSYFTIPRKCYFPANFAVCPLIFDLDCRG